MQRKISNKLLLALPILLAAAIITALLPPSANATASSTVTLDFIFDDKPLAQSSEYAQLTVSYEEMGEYFKYSYSLVNYGTGSLLNMTINDGTRNPLDPDNRGLQDVTPVDMGGWVQFTDGSSHEVIRSAELDYWEAWNYYKPGSTRINFDPIGENESVEFTMYYIAQVYQQPISLNAVPGVANALYTAPAKPSQVPEPETLLLVGIGIFSMGIIRRKRLKKK